ncbi:MAG: hypothetical protein LBH25_03065 [Fibromonadaceae bacterium]|jgi:hypothetical protein|nr:hypothetical protein [Fibromonadaceae bacterium]
MNNKITFVAAAFSVLFLDACDGKREDQCHCGGDFIRDYCSFPYSFCDEDSRIGESAFLLNGKNLFEEEEAGDNCSLPPNPYPPKFKVDTVINIEPDGSINSGASATPLPSCQLGNNYVFGFEDSSIKEACDAWREEIWRMRTDSTRTATLTFSNNQTIIQLSNAFLDASLGWFRLEDNKKNDTLYIKTVDPFQLDEAAMESKCLEAESMCYEKESDESRCADVKSKCLKGNVPAFKACPLELDIALNYIDENIKVVVFEEKQIFQVKRQ